MNHLILKLLVCIFLPFYKFFAIIKIVTIIDKNQVMNKNIIIIKLASKLNLFFILKV